MLKDTVEVKTKIDEKKYKARKEIEVPESIEEAVNTYGKVDVLKAIQAQVKSEEYVKLRTRLIAKVQGKAVSDEDVEEVTDLD